MSYNKFIPLDGTANIIPDDAEIATFDEDFVIGVTILIRRPVTSNGLSMQDYADLVIKKQAAVLSRSEFTNYFSANQSDIDQIVDFANYFGMTLVETHLDSASIKLEAPISVFSQAFNVPIEKITINGVVNFGHTQSICVPKELIKIIYHILGLDSIIKPENIILEPPQVPDIDTQTDAVNDPTIKILTPLQVANAYNFPAANGDNQCIAIISYGGGFTQENLNSSFTNLNLPIPTVKLVSGANSPASATTSTDNLENMLDIAVIGSIVPNANIAFYIHDTIAVTITWVNPFLTAINDKVNNPTVISCSWSFPEAYLTDALKASADTIFAQAVVLGITICCTVGDLGAYSNRAENILEVRFPASSPYVLAVGGTSLILNADNSIFSETAWNRTGGGKSVRYDTPDWQLNVAYSTYDGVNNVVGAPVGLSSRFIPDVAANADPNSGYSLYYYKTGTQTNVQTTAGGTSAAAPLIASLILRLNQIVGSRLGYVNQLFYSLPSGFNDIIAGNNAYSYTSRVMVKNIPTDVIINQNLIGYSATTGWDAVSGLGSPKATILKNLIQAKPVASNIEIGVDQNSVDNIITITAINFKKVIIVTPPTHGTASVVNLTIKYTPNTGYFGLDSIVYKISNSLSESDPALITISVGNLLPVASTVTVTVLPNSVNNVINPNVTNYYNSVHAYVRGYTNGTVSVQGKNLIYTPLTDFVGTDQFQYDVTNLSGVSNISDVIVSVPKPAAPFAYDINRVVYYNSINNIIDPSVANAYSSITVPPFSINSGTVIVVNNKILYSTPNNYSGNDRFTYTATGPGGVATAVVALTILKTTSSNVAFNISQYVKENSVNNLISVNSEISSATYVISTNADHGIASITDNTLYYTPDTNYVGFDRFTYYVIGDGFSSNTASINISVNSLDYTPISFKSTASIFQNSTDNILTPLISNTVTGVLINSNPIFGVVSASTSSFIYTPTSGFVGIDYFYYSAFNAAGISMPARFYIIVNPILMPVANDTDVTVNYNSIENAIHPNVTNPFNTAIVITPPLHGKTTVSNAIIYYTPTTGYSGTDTFYYEVGNLKGLSRPALITVTVLPSTGLSIYPPSGNLPIGFTNTNYTPVTFYGINGTAPYTTVLSKGVLPTGMTLTNNILSGTPGTSTSKLYKISITLTDNSSPTKLVTTGTYTLDIAKNTNTLITAADFNDLEERSTFLTSYLYGSYNLSDQVVVGDPIMASGWDAIYDDMLRCFIHQNGSNDIGFIRPDVGSLVSLGQLDAMVSVINTLTETYLVSHPSQILLDTDGILSASTSTLKKITLNVSFSWSDRDQATYFFNLGGYIKGVMYNTSTHAQISTVFTATNYFNSTNAVVTSTAAVSTGTGTIRISNISGIPGSMVVAAFEVTTSSNNGPSFMAFTATDYYSTDITGGVLAPKPLVQLSNGFLTTTPLAPVTVYGNTPLIVSLVLTNGTSDKTITIGPNDITAENGTPLTVTFLNLPLTIGPNSSNTLQVQLQNWTVYGSLTDFIRFRIMAYADAVPAAIFLNLLVIPLKVTVLFGITVTPAALTATITQPTNFDFIITGYGGRLDSAYLTGNNFSTSTNRIIQTGQRADPVSCQTTVRFDPITVIDGAYSGILTAVGTANTEFNIETSSTAVALNLTIDVTDKNLGTWISGQSPNNTVAGFDYSILNGQRFLTIGFGSRISLNNGGFTEGYSTYSLKSLGRLKYNTSNTFARISKSAWGPFLKTYAIYNPSLNITSNSATFFVRYQSTFQWEFNAETQGSFTIDGQTKFSNQATNNQISYQGSVTLTPGFHTVSWTATGAVGARITYSSGKNQNYDVWSTLDQCFFTSWFEITRYTIAMDGTVQYFNTTLPNVFPDPTIYVLTYSFYFTGSDTDSKGVPRLGMWNVINDGYGYLIISINKLTGTSGVAEIDTTLLNVEKDLFYYYSEISNRYVNVGTKIDDQYSYYFNGFDELGNVVATLKYAPRTQPTQVPTIPISYSRRGFNWWPVIFVISVGLNLPPPPP
jgi:kumamolisin